MNSPDSVIKRLRSLSFSQAQNHVTPTRDRHVAVAQTLLPETTEFVTIVNSFLEARKSHDATITESSIQEPLNAIVSHCQRRLPLLSGEAFVLRICVMHTLARMFSPFFDSVQMIHSTLCTLAEQFFQQDQSERFEVLYGDLTWVHDVQGKLPVQALDIYMQIAKSPDLNGTLKPALEPPLALRDSKHPWHLKKLEARSIVHDWYALSYWVMKLVPLRLPRGSIQASDHLHAIFAKWVESNSTLSANCITTAGAAISLTAIFLEPDKPPKTRHAAGSQAPICSFFKFCSEQTQKPLQMTTWRQKEEATFVIQMALHQLSASNTLKVLEGLHGRKPDEPRFAFLAKSNTIQSTWLKTLIQTHQFTHDVLLEFFSCLLTPNQVNGFNARLMLAQAILHELQGASIAFEHVQSQLQTLHIFIDEANSELDFATNESAKEPYYGLIDAIFSQVWQFSNLRAVFLDHEFSKSLPLPIYQVFSVISEIDSQLYTNEELKERFYKKCLLLFASVRTSDIALKNALVRTSVHMYSLSKLQETRQVLYTTIQHISQRQGQDPTELSVRFRLSDGVLETYTPS